METGKRKEKQEEVVVVLQEEKKLGTLKGLIKDWGVDISAICQEIMDADEL